MSDDVAALRAEIRELRKQLKRAERELDQFRQGQALHAARTREAMGERRALGLPVGRPSVPLDIRERIRKERSWGFTYQRICDGLNRDGIPTARGAALWRPAAVRRSARD